MQRLGKLIDNNNLLMSSKGGAENSFIYLEAILRQNDYSGENLNSILLVFDGDKELDFEVRFSKHRVFHLIKSRTFFLPAYDLEALILCFLDRGNDLLFIKYVLQIYASNKSKKVDGKSWRKLSNFEKNDYIVKKILKALESVDKEGKSFKNSTQIPTNPSRINLNIIKARSGKRMLTHFDHKIDFEGFIEYLSQRKLDEISNPYYIKFTKFILNNID